MEIILFLILMMQVAGQTQYQAEADSPPDIEVVRFSWSRERPSLFNDNRNLNDNRNRADNITLSNIISPQEISRRDMENRNSIENRSQEMRNVERSAIREARSKPGEMYRYRIELKNRGTREIRWIFWDYQTSDLSDPNNPSHREFRCEVKVKPNGTARLEAFTSLPPRRVISAVNAGQTPAEKIIVNRVEYADGGFWQRADWHLPERAAGQKDNRQRCQPI